MSGSDEDDGAFEAFLIGVLAGVGAAALIKILSDMDTKNRVEAEKEMRRRLLGRRK